MRKTIGCQKGGGVSTSAVDGFVVNDVKNKIRQLCEASMRQLLGMVIAITNQDTPLCVCVSINLLTGWMTKLTYALGRILSKNHVEISVLCTHQPLSPAALNFQ